MYVDSLPQELSLSLSMQFPVFVDLLTASSDGNPLQYQWKETCSYDNNG